MTDEDAILAANAAYYHGFGAADLARMSLVWADDDVSCVHPGWPALIGRQAVLQSYRDILGSPLQAAIDYRDGLAMVSGSEGRVFCTEIVGGMTLVATNWFRRIGGDWRLIHHQASPIAAFINKEASQPSLGRLN
ncbi:nuclear transport factor 2 family protein [Methylocapsa aurea]|uniref:nuclear transport factor 2 family protein n=1 Tax=Methylocapsa aurea TaxID=663610 RepID=UPI00056443D0|nr:nuclear transport factor 2 family protein [Methylocapsa aurea]